MLPLTFIDKVDDKVPDFVCDKCSAIFPMIKILMILAQLEEEREVALNPSCDISQYEKILEKQRNILHEGHGDIVDVKILLVSRISTLNSLKHISDELLIKYIKYCKEIVENVKLLMPCEFRTIDSRSLLSFSHFVYCYNIYFIHSRDNLARILSIRNVEDELRIF